MSTNLEQLRHSLCPVSTSSLRWKARLNCISTNPQSCKYPSLTHPSGHIVKTIMVVSAHSAVNSNEPAFAVSASCPVGVQGIPCLQRTGTQAEDINCGMLWGETFCSSLSLLPLAQSIHGLYLPDSKKRVPTPQKCTRQSEEEKGSPFIHGHSRIHGGLAVNIWVFLSGGFVPLNNYIKCLTSLLFKDIN